MKKKIISFILLVVMISSLLVVSAYAQPAVTIVALGNGETVASLCARYGIDYNSYKALIMALNSVSSEAEFANMLPGSAIALPVSAAAAASISSSVAASVPVIDPSTGTASSGANSAAAVGAYKSIMSGDTIGAYIISYTVKSQDTIIGIYRTRGENYKTFSNLILKLNNISNLNNLKVGKTYLLPVLSPAQGDTVVYTMMRHIIKSGETVYNVVSSGYGMSYKDNQEFLKLVNAKDNLGSIKVGEALLIAVKGIVRYSA